MTKYKLRVVGPGDYLYGEDGMLYIGDSAEEAHDFYADEACDPVEWVHPEILRARLVYARDVEMGDCHEDAEPGDTTYDLVTDHPERALRALGENEVRAWPRGAWRPHWSIKPEWSTGVPGDQVTVEGEIIGQFATREEAEIARNAAVAIVVETWKCEYPEFYRAPAPEEA